MSENEVLEDDAAEMIGESIQEQQELDTIRKLENREEHSALEASLVKGEPLYPHELSRDTVYTFYVLSTGSGFANYENHVSSSFATKFRSWGPFLIGGPAENGLVLMVAPDGRVAVWNVELGMCWASMYMCPDKDRSYAKQLHGNPL